jgi:FkbM family methyltransferase
METAVSDTTGSLHMDIPHEKSHYYARISSDGKYTVAAHTFDELFGGLNEVALVKCDVEGHEPELLKGAENFLSTRNAVWLVEMDKRGEEITSIFKRCGYRPEHSDTVNCFFTRQ